MNYDYIEPYASWWLWAFRGCQTIILRNFHAWKWGKNIVAPTDIFSIVPFKGDKRSSSIKWNKHIFLHSHATNDVTSLLESGTSALNDEADNIKVKHRAITKRSCRGSEGEIAPATDCTPTRKSASRLKRTHRFAADVLDTILSSNLVHSYSKDTENLFELNGIRINEFSKLTSFSEWR